MNKKLFRPFFALLLVALIMSGCANAGAAASAPIAKPTVTFKISGSGTITAVFEALKPAFEAATPGYRIQSLPGSGTGGGVTSIIEGMLDLAAMARPPKTEETAKGVKFFEMGIAGDTVIIHPDIAGVKSLTKQQIADIFSGAIANWSKVGGPNLEIILYARDADDTGMKGLRKAILGETPLKDATKILTSQGEMITAVQGTPGAIGIASLPTIRATKANVRALAINGIKPDNASFPILSTMGVGYLKSRESDIQPLLNWLSSAEGQSALKSLGFVKP